MARYRPETSLGAKCAIAEIRTGKRHRRDLGDIDALAASIKSVGLLHPVVVRPDGELIAGERRLKACEQLGWESVPFHVVDIDAIARGELAENAYRKDFTPSEMVAIAATVEAHERQLAKQRMSEGGKVGKLSTPSGKTRDKVAAPLGVSGKTLDKARAVVAAANAEPERFGRLLDDMDRTGRVNGPYKRLQNIKQAQAIRAEPSPLPNKGPYRVAVCDVPWPFEPDDDEPAQRGVWPFPAMSLAALSAMPVGNIMHDDSILWFWTTNFHMRHAFAILDAWGFHKTPTVLTWAKDRMGKGFWLRGQTEHAILAVRGKPIFTLAANETTLLHAPVRAHSQKPGEFYDLVESLCPAPRYCDLFSRYRHNKRWDCHGDEAPQTFAVTSE
jgi:ParB/RepB/Spo0J family partition protein